MKVLQTFQDTVMSKIAEAEQCKDAKKATALSQQLVDMKDKIIDTCDAAKIVRKKVKSWLDSLNINKA